MRLFIISFLLTFFFCCKQNTQDIRIVSLTDEPQHELLGIIGETIHKKLGHNAISIPSDNNFYSLDSLLNNQADIAIVENVTPYVEGVKTIMPLYEQILHVFYNKDLEMTSFKDLCEGKTMYIGEKGSATHMLMQKLFVAFEVDTSVVGITDNVFDDVDVFCAFTHVVRKEDLQGMDDFRLFSFDKVSHIGKGSIIDGLCLRHPSLSPFVIPNQLYNEINEKPILTLSSVALLVGREDLPRDLVYDIVKTLRSSKLQLSRGGVVSLMDFNNSYNLHSLNFPIHPGTMDYLDRHQPSFIERYAEVISVIISLAIAFGSVVLTLNGWSKQRKKKRVDAFYAKIIDIKTISEDSENIIELMQLVNQIQVIQKKAFEMLMAEKLIADESFRIFVELSKDTTHSLESKLEYLQEEILSA